MKVIWKYHVPQLKANVYGPFRLNLPIPFQIVDVVADERGPILWIQHDVPGPFHTRDSVEFQIIGTGHEHEQNLIHQATYRVNEFVWHIMARGTWIDMEKEASSP